MAGLTREVLRWIQSLDLSFQIKTPKWDLCNGYLIAEIFSWYYPQNIKMFMFINGTSVDTKDTNWFHLKRFFKRHKIDLSDQLVENTIHCKEGAALLLLEKIYEMLTKRQVKRIPLQYPINFTDEAYQFQLPMHARSNASKSIKNNIGLTELTFVLDDLRARKKAQTLIDAHLEHRKLERVQDPKRFGIKPTLAERAERKAPSAERTQSGRASGRSERTASENENKTETKIQTTSNYLESDTSEKNRVGNSGRLSSEPKSSAPTNFREIRVQQLNRFSTSQQKQPDVDIY